MLKKIQLARLLTLNCQQALAAVYEFPCEKGKAILDDQDTSYGKVIGGINYFKAGVATIGR